MAKASSPGRTKTRLSPPLSPEQAAELNTVFLADIAANVAAAARSVPIACYMAFGPPGSAPFFEEILPPEVGLIEAWRPTFGDCLYETLRALLELGYGSAAVLNADSPTLPTSLLAETAQHLRRPGDRLVIGPSTDGGYYLLGLKSPHRRLFEDIDWSTARVLQQTRARAEELALEAVLLPPWYDVDDASSLQVLLRELAAAVSAGGSGSQCPGARPGAHGTLLAYGAAHTVAYLRAQAHAADWPLGAACSP